MSLRTLSPLEARVLGVLIEKAHTVPDSYPLSLNSLTLGCNQKTARDPVINASEAEVQMAVDALKGLSLAFESSGSRVTRYEHNLGRALNLPSQSVALLAALLLRGSQTVSELRINCERLHRFADLSAVEGFLDELAARPTDKGGPLVVKLARQPGPELPHLPKERRPQEGWLQRAESARKGERQGNCPGTRLRPVREYQSPLMPPGDARGSSERPSSRRRLAPQPGWPVLLGL